MPKPNDSLVAVLVSKLDDNLLEDWEERASIMQFDALLPKGYAECLAMLDLLCRHPEVLQSGARRSDGVVVLHGTIGQQSMWLLSADSNAGRQYLVDLGATEIRECDLRTVIEEQYAGIAMLATLD
ncbi:MAG: hypothetical protein D4R84_13495 [Rhodocyclaceae bacterium]|nr:MAG: hypothetical protein D4R84_13495 [Rhodocyclaceae bacterium]